jgi:hypothetical protein
MVQQDFPLRNDSKAKVNRMHNSVNIRPRQSIARSDRFSGIERWK